MDNQKKKIIYVFFLAVCFIVTSIIYFLKFDTNIIFAINILIACVICIKAKFSLISIQTVLMNYILLPIFFQYNYGTSYGILEKEAIPLHYEIINYSLIIYNFINAIFIISTKFLEKEKELLTRKVKIKKQAIYILSTMAMIFTLIALPSIPFQTSDTRNISIQALLPGNAWNHLAIICLIFTVSKLKESKYVKFSFIFTIFWFLSHFERVDILGLTLLVILLWIVKSEDKIRLRTLVISAILGIIIFFGMTSISKIRVNSQVTFDSLIKSVFVHNTVSDVAYTYNAAIQYNFDYGALQGKTYKTYIIEAIPLLSSDTKVEKMLQQEYATIGGNYLLGEPYMNFGIVGIAIFKIIELIVIYCLVNSKHKISYFWYLFIIATIFRSVWYGISYIETGILYMVPICYIIKSIKYKEEIENE